MQINKENLTIIIVTIKSDKVIERCLDSIHPDVKKIIIENSNEKKSFQKLTEKYKNLNCYISGGNFGMGKGNNIGIQKSETRYVMILNPDAILQHNTLEKIFKISEGLNFSILSPMNDDKQFPNFRNNKNLEKKKNVLEVECVDGYSMILDKSKFQEKFFDEKIFMYLENDDLCYRMRKKNEKIYIVKDALIRHLGAQAVDNKYLEELELSRNWHWNWSKFYYRKKHYGFIFALLKGLPGFIVSSLKCLFYYLVKNNFKFKIYFNRASGFYNSLINKNSWYRPRFD